MNVLKKLAHECQMLENLQEGAMIRVHDEIHGASYWTKLDAEFDRSVDLEGMWVDISRGRIMHHSEVIYNSLGCWAVLDASIPALSVLEVRGGSDE